MKLTAPPLESYYELERRVAVEIMDLPALEFNERTKCPYCREVGHMGNHRMWCSRCCEWYIHPYRNYRDSVDDAMQVVEKMWQTGWQMEAANGYKLNTLITDNVYTWWVRFIDNENDMNNWSAEADSLPEAICLAALEAVKHKPPVE